MIHASTVHSALSSRAQEYLDGWQRARAELQNLRRRQQEQSEYTRQTITREVIESLLPIADNFHSLNQYAPRELKDNPWAQGVLHVGRQFDQVLADCGVTSFGGVGEKFTPDRHEAIEQIEDQQKESGLVTEVVQAGYQLQQTVIRPAKVKVSA